MRANERVEVRMPKNKKYGSVELTFLVQVLADARFDPERGTDKSLDTLARPKMQ